MLHTLLDLCQRWAAFYSDSATTRTIVGFAHLGGLVVGGGCAIAEDRSILAAIRETVAERRQDLRVHRAAHRTVLVGLTIVMASGMLLLAANLDTYLPSWIFWTKMALIGALLLNGIALVRAERAMERTHPRAWPRLRMTALVSLALWGATTLAGAALPNV